MVLTPSQPAGTALSESCDEFPGLGEASSSAGLAAKFQRRPAHGRRVGTATKGYGSSWIFERCLTCANALRLVQHRAFSLVRREEVRWSYRALTRTNGRSSDRDCRPVTRSGARGSGGPGRVRPRRRRRWQPTSPAAGISWATFAYPPVPASRAHGQAPDQQYWRWRGEHLLASSPPGPATAPAGGSHRPGRWSQRVPLPGRANPTLALR